MSRKQKGYVHSGRMTVGSVYPSGFEDLIASQVFDTFNDDLIREKLHELARVKRLEWRKHLTRIFREVFKYAERR